MSKKTIFILLAVLLFASTAFSAEDLLSSAGTDGELGLGANSTALVIGLSPKVVARYLTEGTAANAQTSQWYAIGTVHPGGSMKYGTAQDLNNIYQDTYATGTAVTNAVLNISTVKASPTVWTGAGWEL